MTTTNETPATAVTATTTRPRRRKQPPTAPAAEIAITETPAAASASASATKKRPRASSSSPAAVAATSDDPSVVGEPTPPAAATVAATSRRPSSLPSSSLVSLQSGGGSAPNTARSPATSAPAATPSSSTPRRGFRIAVPTNEPVEPPTTVVPPSSVPSRRGIRISVPVNGPDEPLAGSNPAAPASDEPSRKRFRSSLSLTYTVADSVLSQRRAVRRSVGGSGANGNVHGDGGNDRMDVTVQGEGTNRFRKFIHSADRRDPEYALSVRLGPFSNWERQVLDRAIAAYLDEHGLDASDIPLLLRRKSKNPWALNAPGANPDDPHKKFFATVYERAGLERTMNSVYEFMVQQFHPNRESVGLPWTPDEDARLEDLVMVKGHKWREIEDTM
ncbi:Pre-mRNA-splicing factor cef1, partial [Cladochytrium tenue]